MTRQQTTLPLDYKILKYVNGTAQHYNKRCNSIEKVFTGWSKRKLKQIIQITIEGFPPQM